MKQLLLRRLILTVAAVIRLLCADSAYASHTMGADLTYECLGGNSYKVTLSFYRDCIGIPAPANAVVTINSPSCGQNLSVTCYPRPGTGQEVTPTCSSSVTTCNGGAFTGIQEWVYDGIVTLPMQCTDWILGYSLCCRNAAITTINTPSSNTFYIYATLNNVVSPCNSSPTFSNKPVPFLCLGQQFCFNHGAYDADGDSLVYKLITPKQTASTNVAYNAPYNANNPLNSSPATQFNNSTGDICLTPQALEVTVMAVLVEEYRNGVKIGTVERDLQLTVMNCANNLPSLTGINGTNNFDMSVCANQQTCFDIFSNDPDAGQQLTVSWNNGIPAGTFTTSTAGHPTGTFCWTPPQSAVGHTYSFTATVTDDACPYFGSQTYSYTINVIGINVSAGPDQAIACSDLATITAIGSGGFGPYTYLWSNGSNMQSITVGAGTYWVTASDGNCTATDTVVITMPFLPVAAFTNTTPGCNNIPIIFTDQSTTTGGSISGWNWNFGDGGTSTVQNPIHQFPGVGTYTVTLIVENTLGCLDTISHQVVVEPPMVAQFTAASACVSTNVSFTDQTTGSPTSWNWLFGDGGISNLQNPNHTYTTPGTYNVTLISANNSGCIDTIVKPVIIYPLPAANAGADISVCTGSPVTLTATGGTSYVWSPIGQTGQTATFTPSGSTTVVVQVTDANGCVKNDTVNVSLNPLPVISAGADQSVCSGQSVTLNAVGGVSYVWNPGGSTSSTVSVSPVSNTTYTVTGTAANGCTSTDAVVVNINALPTANAGPDANICSGASTVLTASGGGTYVWSPGGSTSSTLTVNPTNSQTYQVTVTNGGCSATDSVRVTVNPGPVVNIPSFFLCVGATSVLDAGNPGSTYVWSTGQTTQTININSGGVYTVTVTNASGCTSSASSTVTYDSTITISLANVTFCQGDSAVLDAGYPGMNYLWTPGGQTTQTITVNSTGTYGVTVIDPTGCNGSISVNAIANPLPVAIFNNATICEGDPMSFVDGSSLSSGSINQWSWNFGDGNTSLIQNPVHNYGSAGSYSVSLSVTSAAGCSSNVTNTVAVNSLPTADFTFANTCLGNSASFTDISSITSGNIVSYNWNFGDGNASTLQNPTHNYAAAGNYIVTLQVTSAGGCSNTISKSVTINPKPTASFSAPDACLGSAIIFANSSSIATGSISSNWWDFNDTYTSTQNSPSHTFLASGTYAVRLIVASLIGCSDTIVQNVVVHALPAANAGVDQSICSGNNAMLVATGNGSYMWSPGGMTSDTLNISPSASTVYTLTVTDANGCTKTDAVTVNVNSLPNAQAGNDQNLCSGNSITLNAAGGTNYSWTPGGMTAASITVQPSVDTDYMVTVTDANGCSNVDTVTVFVSSNPVISAGPDQVICSGSTVSLSVSGASSYLWNPVGLTTSTILVTPTATSDYTVIGTNANGCLSYDTVTITVNPIPSISLGPAFICDGYTLTLDAGNPGYTYSWSTGETSQTITVSDSGTYSVVVTGPNGCPAFGTSVVTKYGNPNAPPVNYNFCTGQNVTLNAGNPGATYQWSTGQTSQTIAVSTPGTYFVTITDNNGCSATLDHIVAGHPVPTALFSVSPVCDGIAASFTNQSNLSSGSILSILWDFGDSFTSAANNPSHAYASSGNYAVTLTIVSDAGCSDTIQQNMAVNPLPVADFSTVPTCQNSSVSFSDLSTVTSGSITSLNWNFGDGSTSSQASPAHNYASQGNYQATLIVTSNSGCTDSISKNVAILDLPTASFQSTNVCIGNNVNFVNTSTASGSSIISYLWDFGNGNTSTAFQSTETYANSGTYPVTLIVTSAGGCSDTVTSSVTVYPNPAADFSTNTACLGFPINIQNSSTVGTGSIQNYYWNFGDNSSASTQSPTHTYAADGTFTITLVVTSDNGCIDSTVKSITMHPIPLLAFTSQNVCEGNNVAIINNSTINTGNITQWNWNFGDNSTSNQTAPSHLYASAGTYHVSLVATSNFGCTDSTTGTINIFPNPLASFATANVCSGNGTQFLNLTSISGGGSYTSYWTFGDGDSLSSPNPLHLYLNPGNYNVNLSIVTANGCTDQISLPVSVYNKPIAKFAAPNNCSGQITQFNNTSTSQDGAITSNFWNFGDGTHSIDKNPSHAYTNSGDYNVELSIISSYGCVDSYVDSLAVYSIPQVNIQAGNGCEGTAITISGSTDQPAGANYTWTLPNGSTNTSQTFNYTFNAPGSYNVSLSTVSANGCTGNQSQQVTIFANPTVAFTSNEVCESSSTVFSNLSTAPSGTYSNYTWNFGDNAQSVSNNPSHTYNTWGLFNVALTSTTNQGCTSTITKQVRIHPKPIVNFNGGVQGCSPVNAFFVENSSIPEGTITSWLWNFSDGEVSTDKTVNHVFTQSGTYDATLTVASDFGCTNSYTQSNVVTVYSQPEADFTADPMVTDMSMPVVHFLNQSQNYSTYQWIFGDGSFTNNELNPTHTFGDTGTYSAKLITVTNQGCRDTITKFIEVRIHSTLFIANTFTPNGDGTNDDFRPFWTNMKEIKVLIFDRWGKFLTSWNDLNGSWDGFYQGKKCQQDTYVYKIEGTGLDGKYSEWVGHVNIVY